MQAPESKPTAPTACVDHQARSETEKLAVAIARVARGEVRGPSLAAGSASDSASESSAAPKQPDPGPLIFDHFDVPNRAVTVTQKPDGVVDVRSTDPALSGQVLPIKAYSKSGGEQTLYIRIP